MLAAAFAVPPAAPGAGVAALLGRLIRLRLAGAGIVATQKRSSGMDVPQLGAGGARDIYVTDGDEQRARAALADQDVSAEELEHLAEQFQPPED